MKLGIIFLLGYFLTKFLLPILIRILTKTGITQSNWQGKQVIMMGGLIIPVVLIVTFIFLGLFDPGIKSKEYLYLTAVCAVSLLGAVDDLFGGVAQKGLRGHFIYLWTQRRLSTGVIKALGIGLVALGIIITLQTDYLVLNWLLLVLSANFVNLLDLRPGRAIKSFLIILALAGLLSLCIIITGGGPGDYAFAAKTHSVYSLLAVSTGIVLAYTRYDLRSIVMLGDTGSNSLGFIAGLVILSMPLLLRVFMVLVLIVLHATAEKYSFSKLIEQNSWLDKLDHWGRK